MYQGTHLSWFGLMDKTVSNLTVGIELDISVLDNELFIFNGNFGCDILKITEGRS